MVDIPILTTYHKLLPVYAKAYQNIRLESLKLHPENYGSSYAEQVRLPELRLEHAIKEQDTDRFIIGAFAEKTVIGICGFVVENDFGLGQTGTLTQMYVKEAFRGQKIGLKLAESILKGAFRLPNLERVALEVNPQNRAAIRVYEGAGFETFESNRPPSDKPEMLMIAHTERLE